MIINSSMIASTVRGEDVNTSQERGCLFPITCCLSRKEARLGPDEARADDASGVGMGRLMKVKLLPAPPMGTLGTGFSLWCYSVPMCRGRASGRI